METEQKVSAGTVARTIILILALVNQVFAMLGYRLLPVDNQMINDLVSNLWMIGAALWAWWKNNSFTKSALYGDTCIKCHKEGTTPPSINETSGNA